MRPLASHHFLAPPADGVLPCFPAHRDGWIPFYPYAPETRSLLQMLAAYDPHAGMDLHATNGSRHAYHLTYAPPLHPGTDRGCSRS
jgi:hypothetical protein